MQKIIWDLYYARLRSVRRKKGISQHEMSECTGISQPYLSQIENGERYPGMRKFLRICSRLNVNPGNFFYRRKKAAKGKGERRGPKDD